ncbi:hydroxypyruvate isomerase family protein [Yersinia mollaretii]|uniref:Hydroxypyruvate isomerase family protein n=1 Tax=Yersinia mollaretii TaxID=33060 RepID=A0AA44I1N7_YERMO|nr:2-oxo-tetronate isomerase [Yersinia mollaretii]NIL24765.1 hydroxypyruvate isomerase family protein [Yersinia mollaretii]CNJ48212.1 hydroxypyruvate isomerase [Yersinia mollaretii]CQQ87378.1 hydroxypyruvate isomerase [Yersinia mollaretii]
MPKFAANLSMMFTEVPFLARFKAAADAGFKAVEFLFPYDYPADQLAAQLRQHDLHLALFNTPPGQPQSGEWGLAALPGREAQARQDIDRALEYALALNCHSIHVMAGIVPPTADRAAYQQTFIDNIRYAAEQCAPHQINILIEALSPQVKPHYLFSSQYQTHELLSLIDRGNVFMQLDLFHAQLVDGNLTQIIERFAGRYAHIQIASAPHRHEPESGEVNYPYLFDLLDKIGYRGWIGCEYHPKTDTLAGLGWVKKYLNS